MSWLFGLTVSWYFHDFGVNKIAQVYSIEATCVGVIDGPQLIFHWKMMKNHVVLLDW